MHVIPYKVLVYEVKGRHRSVISLYKNPYSELRLFCDAVRSTSIMFTLKEMVLLCSIYATGTFRQLAIVPTVSSVITVTDMPGMCACIFFYL